MCSSVYCWWFEYQVCQEMFWLHEENSRSSKSTELKKKTSPLCAQGFYHNFWTDGNHIDCNLNKGRQKQKLWSSPHRNGRECTRICSMKSKDLPWQILLIFSWAAVGLFSSFLLWFAAMRQETVNFSPQLFTVEGMKLRQRLVRFPSNPHQELKLLLKLLTEQLSWHFFIVPLQFWVICCHVHPLHN